MIWTLMFLAHSRERYAAYHLSVVSKIPFSIQFALVVEFSFVHESLII